MAGRERTTKKLAQRIEPDYFKRTYRLPRLRWILTIGCTVIGLVWLGWSALARNASVYSSGPIKSAHSVFAQNCAACHAAKAVFGTTITDKACLNCHDAPIHHAEQTFAPACKECHVEHQGALRLARTSDANCTQCHRDLHTRTGNLRYAGHITAFDGTHPEIAILRLNQSDPATIRFNHQVHVSKPIRGAHGNVRLECVDCHRPSDTTARAYMTPVSYVEHCQTCHRLEFDSRFADPVPHTDPEIVLAFAKQRFTEYIAAHPAELRAPGFQARLAERVPAAPAGSPAQWINQRMADAQQLLWKKTCKECHALTFGSGSLPKVEKSNVTARWMSHARFDHKAHQLITCTECHSRAPESRETSDVLLPKIAVCRQCHDPGDSHSAESSCFECHQYHDSSKTGIAKGAYKIKDLVRRSEPVQ